MTATQEKAQEAKFSVAVDGEVVGEYAKRDSAKKREKRERAKNPQANVVFTDLAELERQVEEAIEVEERMAPELAGKEDGFGNAVPTDDQKAMMAAVDAALEQILETSPEEHRAGSPGWAAQQKLTKGEVSQEGYRQVCNGTITLDEAVRRVKDGEEEPAVVTVERERQEKKAANGQKVKREPKPPATWSVEVMDEAGQAVEEVLIDQRPAKEFGGCQYFGRFARGEAKERGRLVVVRNNKTGTTYPFKPRKQKAKVGRGK
jgi:hypothetical protein